MSRGSAMKAAENIIPVRTAGMMAEKASISQIRVTGITAVSDVPA